MTDEQLRAKYEKEERNKRLVGEFFQALMGDHDYDKAATYMGEYIQHDPEINGNGIEPLKLGLTTNPKYKDRPKGVKVNLTYFMADGDFVSAQNRKVSLDGTTKILVQHVFRLNEEGKIDEHWTIAASAVIADAKNELPLY